MAGPFPTGDFGRRTSDNLIGADIGAPAAGVAGAVGAAAEGFGRTLKGMAERAWTREGESDAARAINAENESGIEARIRPGQGIDDQAYNAVVREKRGAERQTAYLDAVSKAKIDHPDNVAGFAEAVTAARAAFAPTGDAQLDVAFDRFRTLTDGAALRDVREGEERRRVQTARGAFVTALSSSETLLGQSIASAGFDDQGSALVGASLTEFASSLSRFGPREAFTLNGVEFAADPTRANAVSPEEMGRLFDAAQANARTSWIARAMERAPDAASKQAFAGQVRERWAAGDKAFAGLSAQDMDRLTNRLDADVASAVSGENAARDAAAQRTRQLFKAAEYGGEIDPAEVRAQALASGDLGLIAEAEFGLAHGFDVTPAELRRAAESGSGVVGGAAFDVIDFIMDDLEGSGFVADDNGRGRAQWGITEKSHPAAWLDGRIDRAEAYAIYKREYLDPLGPLSAEMQIVAGAAAVVSGVGKAREFLAKAGGDPERFLRLEREHFENLARRNPGRYGDDLRGWSNRQGKVRGALQRHRTAVRSLDGFRSDPIGFAVQKGSRVGLPPVSEVDPSAMFEGAPGWGAGIRAQAAAGREMARQFQIAPRILSEAQEDTIKARLMSDPASVMTFTKNLVSELGEDDARQVLGEVGRNPGQASADLHMASLALDAGARAFAAQATEGRRLMAEGAAPPKFESGEGLEDVQRTVASAYRTMPDLAGPVLATARAAATADAARGQQRPAEHYVQSALGRNPYNGKFYGGAADVNGAQTLLPSWVRQDAMDEVLTWVSRAAVAGNWGPVFDNGQPIPVSGLARMQLQAQPDGQYRLINPRTGRPVPNRQGRPWEFDIDTDERHAALRRAMPDLIRPRR
ncbi:hypothetical protein HNP47_000091 [Brevundimonas vesicularis]|uniref:Uncharacterized protein n=1 Tax=Brevundimonas vesicularis TaxID=41276 RepID=A0A7W9FRD6_BREVE|nr:hypothetical protein [Brevundimonas vesicularis]MBB5770122.1 hypothetical protein [Brevundimonas vesicularis]